MGASRATFKHRMDQTPAMGAVTASSDSYNPRSFVLTFKRDSQTQGYKNAIASYSGLTPSSKRWWMWTEDENNSGGVAHHCDCVAARARHHKQVPNSMGVFDASVQHKEHYAQGIGQTAGH